MGAVGGAERSLPGEESPRRPPSCSQVSPWAMEVLLSLMPRGGSCLWCKDAHIRGISATLLFQEERVKGHRKCSGAGKELLPVVLQLGSELAVLIRAGDSVGVRGLGEYAFLEARRWGLLSPGRPVAFMRAAVARSSASSASIEGSAARARSNSRRSSSLRSPASAPAMSSSRREGVSVIVRHYFPVLSA